jgi:copper chaperone NosL
MTIVDDRYAAETITGKGRVYKFDDVVCMKQFIAAQPTDERALHYVEDYLKQEAGAIDATSAVYLQHDFFSSPMNGNYAAFATEADASRLRDSLNLQPIKWEDLR